MAPKPALWAIKWGVKDGILFNSLYRMTFMPGCCPILSPGVARRQERPHRECILGNDESDEWNPQLCHLLSAFNIVIARVNGKKKSSVFKKWVSVEQLHYGKPQNSVVDWRWREGGGFCPHIWSMRSVKYLESLSCNPLQINKEYPIKQPWCAQ